MIYNQFVFLDSGVLECMISFSTIKNKITKAIGQNVSTIVTSFSVFSGYKYYSTSSNNTIVLYGNTPVDKTQYPEDSIKLLRELSKACDKKDVESIYRYWAIVLCNPGGIYSQNYGKLNNIINMMSIRYNKLSNGNLNEKDFLLSTKGVYDERTINTKNDDPYNNVVETITMDVCNIKNGKALEYIRNTHPHMGQNLGGQSDNDSMGILWYNRHIQQIEFVCVDCKKTDLPSFKLKLLKQLGMDEVPEMELIPNSRANFGCNLYLIAMDHKDVKLSEIEKKTVLKFINIIADKNPTMFKEYQESKEFKLFQETGHLNVLSTSIYPFPKAITNYDVTKYFKPYNPAIIAERNKRFIPKYLLEKDNDTTDN